MTENERYGGKDYVEKGSKGDAKQKAWLEMITSCMKETNLSSSATRIWNNLENGGFENIPRKKSKCVSDKVEYVFSVAISSEFCMRQYTDHDPREDAPHYTNYI